MSLAFVGELLLSGAGASVDTRTLRPGEVFFALPGRSRHGAEFAEEAWQKGASAIVLPQGYPSPSGIPSEHIAFHPDPLRWLGEIAAEYRRRFSLPVVAVGGSNGKTTTKALIGHLLGSIAPTLGSPKSWNNAIGLPLTLLRLKPSHAYAVVEIGDNAPGEVRLLAQIADPTLAVITNIGEDHLAGYGSLQKNLDTKWELAEYLVQKQSGQLLLNSEDALLCSKPLPEGIAVAYFGNGPGSLAEGTWTPLGWDCSRVTGYVAGTPFSVEVPLWGSYNRLNVLAALAVVHLLGVPWDKAMEGLRSFQPEAYRSEVRWAPSGQIQIVEAYNANPSSLRVSLSALWETLPAGQKAALVLGQMEELGEYALPAHKAAIEALRPEASRIAGVAFVGPLWEAASPPGLPFPHAFYPSVEALKASLPAWLGQAPVLYLKGSRAQALETLLPSLA
ncbi:MAG: UDP-N-acetylmuramoyl-tripeptide--D-alanyl-D-alanine ligase [Bacteroidia bacterium]|nr:UDP-N-acetylmuramoyl-tripeptide--D-alanyl-D-alanine ligase [Bacteroidia bacterium]GIV23912.1 MAG: UDP-N-acetylmuramoyl-tripeptide--D-alanyl-D-alanine ligase [Bacteroidia bacterium]